MIGALQGEIFHKNNNSLILMVNGIGYKVFVPGNLLEKSKIHDQQLLYIHTHVREDMLNLFGFKEVGELDLFELLISVSGIGPKTAMLVIDRGVSSVKQAISNADVSFFSSIPRLGKKNSQKIIIELKNKLGSLLELDLSNDQNGETQDIISALKQIGFTQKEIIEAIKKLPENDYSLSQKIKETLKILGK
jgi:holliday junction DNA helicase RuvA